MENKLIENKITELRELLEKELPETATSFELQITGTSTHTSISYKTAAQLKKENISMRNIRGEFIK